VAKRPRAKIDEAGEQEAADGYAQRCEAIEFELQRRCAGRSARQCCRRCPASGFSYSLYLTHGLVLLMCEGAWKALGVHATTALVMGTLVGVPAALLAGRLFFQHFEKPLLLDRETGSGSARNCV